MIAAGRRARRRRARVARRARQSVPGDSRSRSRVAFVAHVDRAKSSVKIVVGDRGAGAADRRMERLDAGRAAAGGPARRCPARSRFLLEAARPVFRALRQPDQSRSVRPGAADLHARGLRRRAGEASGRFYTQGMPEDTQAAERPACSSRDEFLAQARIAADENLRQFDYVLDALRRRPALLLLRQRRSGVAHDVAGVDPSIPPTMPRPTRRYAHVVEDLYVRTRRRRRRDAAARWVRTTCSW